MNNVFRSKSIDRISSPEQLNDYVRVSNPGVWMALVSIIVLLIGACVWGVFGKMEVTVSGVVIAKNGNAVCYVNEDRIDSINAGQTIRVENNEYTVKTVSSSPVQILDNMDAYAMHLGTFTKGDWAYELKLNANLPNGAYSGTIVIESVRPLSFLVN